MARHDGKGQYAALPGEAGHAGWLVPFLPGRLLMPAQKNGRLQVIPPFDETFPPSARNEQDLTCY